LTSHNDILYSLYDALVTVETKSYVKEERNIICYLYCINTSGPFVKMLIKWFKYLSRIKMFQADVLLALHLGLCCLVHVPRC